MATKYPQHLLTTALADRGDKTIPPATSQQAGTGRFSQAEGWREETSQPIGEGGMPPKREDFNGAFYLLSQLLLWYQQGGLMNYSTSLDYEVGNEVLYQGIKYKCLKANGPSSKPVTPGTDATTWSDTSSSVLYVPQTLQAGQQQQARTNIGALGKKETAASAEKLAASILISLVGDVTGSASTDLSGNVQINSIENLARGIDQAFKDFAEAHDIV